MLREYMVIKLQRSKIHFREQNTLESLVVIY